MRVFRFDEIDSTNSFLREKEDLQPYDTAIAKFQSAGRGRRGNAWISDAGAALFSFALHMDREVPLEEYMKLPLVTGYAVMRALEEKTGRGFMFKWTNDVYLFEKKISGVLIERKDDFFIVGIGVNVNNCEFGELSYKASSIFKETGEYFDTEEIILHIIESFKRVFAEFIEGGWEQILKDINSRNFLYGRSVEIHIGERIEFGVCQEIDMDGTLKVVVEDEVKNFSLGEVHLRW